MAKRRKEKDEEEDIDFKAPKFDAEKFINKEKRNIRASFISFIFGVIIAILSFGFWTLLKNNYLRWSLVFLFGFFCAAWLRYILIKVNTDFEELGRKGQFTTFAIYFFTWLLILIVIVNPPFYDEEPPNIEIVALPSFQEPGGTVKIVARIIDNSGIDDIDFSIKYKDKIIDSEDAFVYDNSYFIYEYKNQDDLIGIFNFTISAVDNRGLQTIVNDKFEYSNDAIRLAVPSNGAPVTYATTIKLDLKSDVDRVYYTIDNGKGINATFKDDFYETFPKFNGWIKDKMVEMKVYAEVIHYFSNSIDQFNNTIIDMNSYKFNVSNAQEIGLETPPKINMPKPKLIQVPGFEIAIFLISLISVVVILKKHKKNHNK